MSFLSLFRGKQNDVGSRPSPTETNVLVSYIRPYIKQGVKVPIGCVVAVRDRNNGRISYGWSLCNPNDHFVKRLALNIAIGRARAVAAGRDEVAPAARWYFDDELDLVKGDVVGLALDRMKERVEKYFR